MLRKAGQTLLATQLGAQQARALPGEWRKLWLPDRVSAALPGLPLLWVPPPPAPERSAGQSDGDPHRV